MNAFQLPKETDTEKEKRNKAIQEATKYAILTPFEVMKTAYNSMEVMKAMIEHGNPNSITDAAVGALCARTAIIGAFLNVKINCGDYEDKIFVKEILTKGEKLVNKANKTEEELINITNSKI